MAEGELDFSAVMSKLMNDKNVAELIGSIKANAESSNSVQSQSTEVSVKPASEKEESGGSIDPGIVEKLPEIMAAIGPLMKKGSIKSGGAGSEVENRNCLLRALKPYLSENRRDMIDGIMTLSKLTSLIDLLPHGKE